MLVNSELIKSCLRISIDELSLHARSKCAHYPPLADGQVLYPPTAFHGLLLDVASGRIHSSGSQNVDFQWSGLSEVYHYTTPQRHLPIVISESDLVPHSESFKVGTSLKHLTSQLALHFTEPHPAP